MPKIFQHTRRYALRVVAVYALVAGLWIVFSDRALSFLFQDAETLTRLQTYKGLFFVATTSLLLFWLILGSLRAIRAKDRMLREIFAGISGATGEEFFRSFVHHLCRALGCDYAYVGELSADNTTATTVAIQALGAPADNFTYALSGTPCAEIASGNICIHDSGVTRLFPEDRMLREMGIESFVGAPLRNSRGEPIGILAIMNRYPIRNREEIETVFTIFAQRAAAEMERRHVQEELQAAAIKYRIISDNTYNWEFWVAPEGHFVYSSPSCERVTGWPSEILLADPAAFSRILHPDDRQSFADHQQEVMSRQVAGEIEFRIVRPDGAIRWIHHVCQSVFDDNGNCLGRRGSNLDITERKEIEQFKDEMISAVSHEMRTPLTAILGFSEFLLTTEVDEEHRKSFLSTMYRETSRLNELIGNFLDLQQLRAHRITFRPTDVEVLPLLEEAAATFTVESEHHRIVIDCAPDLTPIRGDAARIHQALTNLVSNAIKYSPRETVVTLGGKREGERLVLSVRDQGIGIPLDQQERIFEKFFRLDNTDRRPVGGAGLGLAIVREIMAAHGGEVRVESSPGGGSVFSLDFPIYGPAREAQESSGG